jgi:hypothetical protein
MPYEMMAKRAKKVIMLYYYLDSCTSSETGTWDGTCKDLFPKGTDYPESKEWISAKLVGAWYRVKFPKAFRMSKAIIQQRSWENSQIKDVAVEFDTGPSIQVCSSNDLCCYLHLRMNSCNSLACDIFKDLRSKILYVIGCVR